MPQLQFQPLSSQPTPSFWSALNTFKLEHLKLDDTPQPITAWFEEARDISDREKGGSIGVDGSVGVGGRAFGQEGERYVGWSNSSLRVTKGNVDLQQAL
jgi:ubiquitin-like modifier-activating enzyme ATG7